MRLVWVAILCFTVGLSAFPTDLTFKVTYDGGFAANCQPGEHMTIDLVQNRLRIEHDQVTLVDVPVANVLAISYGEDVHQVGSAVGLSQVSTGLGALVRRPKSHKYYIGFTWDKEGTKSGAVFQVSKNEYRGMLSSLEDLSGKRAIDTADKAPLTR